jgi:predicted HAD superfamily Cof-like phosphohydrolase
MTISPVIQSATPQHLIEQAFVFRLAAEQSIDPKDDVVQEMQMRLIREEFHEFIEAHCAEDHGDDSEHTLKELADLVFVCYQYAVARGWNLDIAMRRVFESNMSKFVDGKPLRREDGKILKGPNYQPPSLTDLL